jgi:hypothetical protein
MAQYCPVINLARALATIGAIALAVSGAACAEEGGKRADEESTSIAPTTPIATSTATTTSADAPAVAVTAVDYRFEGLPSAATPGTQMILSNRSVAELHELVALRIPDSERRPVSELVQLAENELDSIFGSGPPATVIVAPPGQSGIPVVGNGALTEAGRYAILCFIPTGADPQEYMRAIQAGSDGPPQVAGGPPHVVRGMFAELPIR